MACSCGSRRQLWLHPPWQQLLHWQQVAAAQAPAGAAGRSCSRTTSAAARDSLRHVRAEGSWLLLSPFATTPTLAPHPLPLQVRIVSHAFDIVHLLTDQNPIQVLVDAVINR